MEEEGVVTAVSGETATVQVTEAGGCQGCAAAGSCKTGAGGRTLEAINRAGARPGQCVVIDIESGAFLKASFIVYVVPVIALFAGAFLGGMAAGAFPGIMGPETWQALGGVGLLALSILVIRLYDRKVKASKGLRPVIVRIKED